MSPVLPVTGHLLLLAWHQHNSGIRQPSLSPPFSNKCWIHPWTKARLWELWDSAPHTKRPRRGLKPLPSMHQILGRQSLGAVWSRQAPATFRSPSQPQQGNTKRVLPGELSSHPTLAFSHRVQKSVPYICVSSAISYTGSSLPSF